MKYCILMGSPRKSGNTIALLKPFIEELEAGKDQHKLIWLYDKKIEPCIACRMCQADWQKFGCRYRDDVPGIFDNVLSCDVIVLATPVYSWYCTPPMKALLDGQKEVNARMFVQGCSRKKYSRNIHNCKSVQKRYAYIMKKSHKIQFSRQISLQ